LAVRSPNACPLIETLLNAGADVNARDAQGRTALHHTLDLYSFAKCKQVLSQLLRADADPNAHCDVDGNTPLHIVASLDLQERQYVMELEKRKATFTSVANEVHLQVEAIQSTPFPKLVEVDREKELADVVKLLLRHGADALASNYRGEIPLQHAIKSRNVGVAFVLLTECGGSLDITMESLGDQELLDAIVHVLKEAGDITN
jgi:ankyrin repeat protein